MALHLLSLLQHFGRVISFLGLYIRCLNLLESMTKAASWGQSSHHCTHMVALGDGCFCLGLCNASLYLCRGSISFGCLLGLLRSDFLHLLLLLFSRSSHR